MGTRPPLRLSLIPHTHADARGRHLRSSRHSSSFQHRPGSAHLPVQPKENTRCLHDLGVHARHWVKKMGKQGRRSCSFPQPPSTAQGSVAMPRARTGTLLPGPSHLLSEDRSASSTQRGAHRAGCCGVLGAWGEKAAAVRIQTWLPRGDKLVTLRGTCPWGGVAGRHPWVLPSILGAAGRSRGRAEGP